jgi:hypothetical protein
LAKGVRELPGALRENFFKAGLRPSSGPPRNGPLEFVQVLLNQIADPLDLFPFGRIVLHQRGEPVELGIQSSTRLLEIFEAVPPTCQMIPTCLGFGIRQIRERILKI